MLSGKLSPSTAVQILFSWPPRADILGHSLAHSLAHSPPTTRARIILFAAELAQPRRVRPHPTRRHEVIHAPRLEHFLANSQKISHASHCCRSSPPLILNNLKKRFEENSKIYTNIGNILVRDASPTRLFACLSGLPYLTASIPSYTHAHVYTCTHADSPIPVSPPPPVVTSGVHQPVRAAAALYRRHRAQIHQQRTGE